MVKCTYLISTTDEITPSLLNPTLVTAFPQTLTPTNAMLPLSVHALLITTDEPNIFLYTNVLDHNLMVGTSYCMIFQCNWWKMYF